MVEEEDFPIPLGVATFTRLAKSSLVNVIILMTGVAAARGLALIKMPSVTGFALRHPMPSSQ